ncbi:MAG: dihydrofolate reductase [Prevotellaceae bacterium]|nr:dihydrofolate reductase [Candidatus Minthosoma equi]
MISIIVAIAENRAIGFENKLIYWLPNDLKRFKALTTGNTIIMGRRTFESLPKGALPNRRNIVLSRNGKAEDFPGADLYADLDSALASCTGEVYIIGGSSVYREAMPKADHLCLTYIYDTPQNADTFFPEINSEEWEETFREEHDTDEKHAQRYAFVDLVRK